MKVEAIPADIVPKVWDKVLPHIEKAVGKAHGEVTAFSAYNKLVTGQWALWLIVDDEKDNEIVAVHTLKVTDFSSGKRVLELLFVGGERLEEWSDLFMETVTLLAKDTNCEEIYMAGRDGWERYMKRYSFEKLFTTLAMKVGD